MRVSKMEEAAARRSVSPVAARRPVRDRPPRSVAGAAQRARFAFRRCRNHCLLETTARPDSTAPSQRLTAVLPPPSTQEPVLL